MKFDDRLPDEGINVSPEHPLRELGVLLAGLVGAAVAAVCVLALTLDRLIPLIPPSVEARLFGSAAGEAEPGDPRPSSVQALLDRLVDHWPEAPFPFHADVLEAETPNAMAFPGGRIVVTTGLLDGVASENELAFVLGHELGHYHGRDHLRGLGRGLAMTLVFAALGAAGTDVATNLAGTASRLAERSFGRAQERDADTFGLALVQAEYGHVAGALDFFERLPQPDGEIERHLESYVSTHPLSGERAEVLRAEARARGWRTDGVLTALER